MLLHTEMRRRTQRGSRHGMRAHKERRRKKTRGRKKRIERHVRTCERTEGSGFEFQFKKNKSITEKKKHQKYKTHKLTTQMLLHVTQAHNIYSAFQI